MLVKKYGYTIQQSLFAWTNQDSTFSHTRENSKMFNITSKNFSFFKNKPPVSWVAHITRNFFTCYSCSYYSSIVEFAADKMQNLIRKQESGVQTTDLHELQKIVTWLGQIGKSHFPNKHIWSDISIYQIKC